LPGSGDVRAEIEAAVARGWVVRVAANFRSGIKAPRAEWCGAPRGRPKFESQGRKGATSNHSQIDQPSCLAGIGGLRHCQHS